VQALKVEPKPHVSRNHVKAMIYRQLILYRRHLDRLTQIAFWPVVDAILFGAIGTYAASHGSVGSAAVLLSGFLMAQIVWQSHIHFCKFFMQEGWDWNVLFMMTRPLRSREVLTAVMLLTVCIASFAGLFIGSVVAIVFHLNLGALPVEIAALIPILLLLGWSTALLATGIVLRMGQKADEFVWTIFGLIGPLSGAIVPVENLPGFLKYVAILIPTTHAYEAGRAMLFGDQFPAAEYTIAATSTIATFGVCLWFMSRSFKKFRQLGYVSRYM
jgi:ABC-2 type transport system permease protein